MKQFNSGLPDYNTSVKCSDNPGDKETKRFIGLKELYKIQEDDEKLAKKKNSGSKKIVKSKNASKSYCDVIHDT